MRIIRGKYGKRRFDVPRNITARPTTDFARENIFNVLENYEDFEGLHALDLFAGTGAISLEFLSRGCDKVTSVEMAAVQYRFMNDISRQLGEQNWNIVKTDALRFIERTAEKYDIIFADPPYNMPGFAEIPTKILSSQMLKSDTIVIIEHSKAHDFSTLPHFWQHRAYGSVNFSLFRLDL